jgi:hypothetical protein
MAAITDLLSIIDPKFRTEINAVLAELDSKRIAGTIEELAAMTAVQLGSDLDRKIADTYLNDLYFTTIDDSNNQSAASLTLANHIIGNINGPKTKREQNLVNSVWDYFYELYSGTRKEMIRFLGIYFQDNLDLAANDNPFDLFSKQSQSGFKNSLDDSFYQVYATYLISEARQYLRTKRESFMLTGRILEDDGSPGANGKPVKEARIKALTNSSVSFSGETKTNFDGYYNLYFSSLAPISGNVDLDISIEKSGFNTITSTRVTYEVSNPKKVLVTELTPSNQSSSALISDVISNLGLSLPPNLITFFNNNNIDRLSGIRSVGLLVNRKELAGIRDNLGLKRMDALAMLELVDNDYTLNNNVFNSGSENFLDVAAIPRGKWVEDGGSLFANDYEAVQYHAVATGQSQMAINEINPNQDALDQPPAPDPNLEVEEPCGCGDCESAVGPMAYLADLLSFTSEKLIDNTTPVDISWLTTNLFRDFGAIPISCDELENNICQARIAAETLETNYSSLTSVPASISTKLDSRERDYLIEAYKTVLVKVGTSYEELLSFQSITDTDERKRYTDRLGIVATPEGTSFDTIEIMFKDITATSPVQLTAQFLEEKFGIDRINGSNPNNIPDFQEWREQFTRDLWRQRDHVDTVFSRGEKVFIDPDFLTVDDFRLPNVARSESFKIWVNRMNLIYLEAYNAFHGVSTVSAKVGLLAGQFTYVNRSNNNVNRSNLWNGNSLSDLKSEVEEAEKGNQSAIANLDSIYKLDLNQAQKILELNKKYPDPELITGQDEIDLDNILTVIVKREFSSNWISEENSAINAGVIDLSNLDFWISEKEPQVGNWPLDLGTQIPLIDPETITLDGLPERTYQVMNKRIFEVVNTVDIETPTELYNRRQLQLFDLKTTISELANLTAMVDFTYENTTPPYTYSGTSNSFEALNNRLNDPVTRDAAITDIETILNLSVEEFTFIMGIGSKYGTSTNQFDLNDGERLFSILVTSRKFFSLYQGWSTIETTNATFWELRKAQLPTWRTSVQERDEWISAFKEHNKAPVIDGDLIGPAYMKNPISTDPAFALWIQRYNQMNNTNGWYDEVKDRPPFNTTKNVANYDDLIEFFVFSESGVKFEEVILRQEANQEIERVLEQLNLTASHFAFLRDLRKALGNSLTLSENQLEKLYYTIANTQKLKQFYKYKIEERDSDVTKSPTFFVSRDTDYYTYPPTLPYELNEYLVSQPALNDWRNTVSSRKDEYDRISLDYTETRLDVDDETLPYIRDAYVEAVFDSLISASPPVYPNSDINLVLSEKARKLGDRLFIDLQDNCCSKTNRVAMAIETMQQLIWKSHTEDILSDYPDMKLNVDSFDSVWQWMGSYGNWRASMFVYLYPENILLPSLKNNKTSGFRNVIKNTQNNRFFNPVSACETTEEYRKYLEDVSNLELKYSAQTNVVAQKVEKCAGLAETVENLTFVFATSKTSSKPYFMTVKTADNETSQKSYWAPVPNIPENAILKGTDVYERESLGINYVYLFYMLDAKESNRIFYCIRFDANKGTWMEKPDEYKIDESQLFNDPGPEWYVPVEELDKDFKLVNAVVTEGTYRWQAPNLFITIQNGEEKLVFTRHIGRDGVNFNTKHTWDYWIRKLNVYQPMIAGGITLIDEPRPLTIKKSVFIQRPVTPSNATDWWFHEYFMIDDSNRVFKLSRDLTNGDQKLVLVSRAEGNSNSQYPYQSMYLSDSIFSFEQSNPIFRIILESTEGEEESSNSLITYAENFEDNETSLFFLNSDFSYSIPNRGNLNSVTPFIYQARGSSNQIFFTSISYNGAGQGFTFGSDELPLTPTLATVPSFDSDMNQSKLALKRLESIESYNANNIERNPLLLDYIMEAYYLVPMEVALRLSNNGYYQEALEWFRTVYDFRQKLAFRKIYFGLATEQSFANLQDRTSEWFKDPLNPHAIASTRKNAYTRFTIMSIANTLLAYANAEFTRDNAESNPRARETYEDIIDLMSVLDTSDPCEKEEAIQSLDEFIREDLKWTYAWQELLVTINTNISKTKYDQLIIDITGVLGGSGNQETKYENVKTLIDTENSSIPTETLNQRTTSYRTNVNKKIGLSLFGGELEGMFETSESVSRNNLNQNLTSVTGYEEAQLPSQDLRWLYDGSEADQAPIYDTNPVAQTGQSISHGLSSALPIEGFNLANPFPEIRVSGMPYLFCVNPNPIPKASLLMAHGNLYKIHNCMNIAGMVRELNPFAAPTDATSGIPAIGAGGTLQIPSQASVAPTNYRYQYLVERAKQLTSFAQQMESSLLASFEKFDAESYAELKAEQDLELAKAGIKLQELRIKEAESGKELAELQKGRAEIQRDGLQEMIDEGLLSAEITLVSAYTAIGVLQVVQAILASVERQTELTVTALSAGGGTTAAFSVAAASAAAAAGATFNAKRAILEGSLAGLQTTVNIASVYASLQRRQQEWEFQKSIATQDVRIGDQQIQIAEDRIRVVTQEREIAELRQEQAQATLDFLRNKFTNADLYEWMSGILQDTYSFFLQEATAMAQLAEQQLAFERQFNPPGLIKSDYWNVNANDSFGLSSEESPDRRGLTGSARLLRDLSELDIYAQNTDQRKLYAAKVMSLGNHDPVEMQSFKETGVLRFTTTQQDFDRDHPGQYLRIIKRISVTIIALTPPIEGIKASLINNGISTVVTSNNGLFQTKTVVRQPERIILSSPYNDTGIFQLENNSNMYAPFEGSGVETLWELRMEKAANPFDYESIADVLITFEYDSLHSESYSQIIRSQLNNQSRPGFLVLSLRNDLPDQWYELQNPGENGLSTSFEIRNSDLAPNVLSNQLTKVKVFSSFDTEKMEADGVNTNQAITGFFRLSKGSEINDENTGAEAPMNKLLEEGRFDFPSFPGTEQEIQDTWYLQFTETSSVLEMIEKEHLRDMVVIIEYSAERVPFNINGNA